MNFTSRRISYLQTGYFSRLITDYLQENESLRDFYKHPATFEGIEVAMQDREKFATNRPLLVEALSAQYSGLAIDDAVNSNLKSLLDKNTFTVTTAHQPAIFTGHLYFIYKTLHVIKIAETLSDHYPKKHFVPVFYMGSEDADLDELGHIYLDTEKIEWETKQTGAVGRMSVAGLEKILQRIEGEFAGHTHGPELIQLLKDCYINAENIQGATFRLLNYLFGSYGLIVLIPDKRLLKSVMENVFMDDLTNHAPFEVIGQHVQHLSKHYPIQANPREINLFYLKDDIRERIVKKDNHYQVLNTKISFSSEEIIKELNDFPERFSPNVILRGLYQEILLPNIAFVGGGGETAYWLELKPLFEYYKVPYPVLVLRNSFMLIKKNWMAKMNKSGLSPTDMFNSEEQLMEEYVRRNSTHQLNLDKQIVELRGFYDHLKNISGAVDKTLEQHVSKLETQSLQKLDELEKKMVRAEKKNHDEIRRRIHEIRSALFPLNNLQERVDNFIPWFADYGKSFLELILKHSPSLEQQFVILEENS